MLQMEQTHLTDRLLKHQHTSEILSASFKQLLHSSYISCLITHFSTPHNKATTLLTIHVFQS